MTNPSEEWTNFVFVAQLREGSDACRVPCIDLAGGDIVAGMLLRQLTSLTYAENSNVFFHDGKYWIYKSDGQWWEETRLAPQQTASALALLECKGAVELATIPQMPGVLVRLVDTFYKLYHDIITIPPTNPYK